MGQTKPKILTIAQKAWIAGFIDGEGYMGVVRQRKKESRIQSSTLQYHPLVIVTNTEQDPIRTIQGWTGLGKVVRLGGRGINKAYYQLKITKFDEIESLLVAIKNFLQIKLEQADLLLEFIETRRNAKIITGRGKRGSTSFGNKEETIYLRLKGLNKRGGDQDG